MSNLKVLENQLKKCGFTVELRKEPVALGGIDEIYRIFDDEGRMFSMGFGKENYDVAVRKGSEWCSQNKKGTIIAGPGIDKSLWQKALPSLFDIAQSVKEAASLKGTKRRIKKKTTFVNIEGAEEAIEGIIEAGLVSEAEYYEE